MEYCRDGEGGKGLKEGGQGWARGVIWSTTTLVAKKASYTLPVRPGACLGRLETIVNPGREE